MNPISEKIFDTLVDTTKIYVSMKDKFVVRNYTNSQGQSPISLHITGDYARERISLNINVNPKEWDSKKERLTPSTKENQDINLILDNIKSKITEIKTSYRLGDRVLTPENLKKEFLNGMPRVRFTAFYELQLEEEKVMMEIGSYNRYKSVLKKIKAFDDDVTFMDVNQNWLDKFRKHLRGLGNEYTTVSGNIAAVKKFLGLAHKAGIKLSLNLDEINVGSTKGNRTSLTAHELKRSYAYFESEFINDSHRLILGYFLFSCMTGLRISDIQKLKRSNFIDNYITFVAQKTKKDQSIALNLNAQRILSVEPLLFEKKFKDQHINDELKKIMAVLKIQKKVSFHVARHTFATSFLRAGGQVEKLQRLLGHSDIKQTMIYAHIVQADANSEIFLLDTLF